VIYAIILLESRAIAVKTAPIPL